MTDIIIEEGQKPEEIIVDTPEVVPEVPSMGEDKTTLAEDIYEKEMEAKREELKKQMDDKHKEEEKIFEEKLEKKEEENKELLDTVEETIEDISGDSKANNQLTQMIKVLADKVEEYQKTELEYERMKMKLEHEIKKKDMEIEILKEDNDNKNKENIAYKNTTGKTKITDNVLYYADLLEEFEKNPQDSGVKERITDYLFRGMQFVRPDFNPVDEKKVYKEKQKAAMLASTAGGGISHVTKKQEESGKLPLGWVPVKKNAHSFLKPNKR